MDTSLLLSVPPTPCMVNISHLFTYIFASLFFLSQQEWPKRWESFPKKLMVAYAKYHAITIVMRIYESIAARLYDDVMVDKLTIDTYGSTLRRQKKGEQYTGRELFSECWYSNFIAYLADYSVHQVIVAFGYFMYIREQRRRLKSKNSEEAKEAANELHPGSLVLSFTKKVCCNELVWRLCFLATIPVSSFFFYCLVRLTRLHKGGGSFLRISRRRHWCFHNAWMGKRYWYQHGRRSGH